MSRIVLVDTTPLGLLSHPDLRTGIVEWADALTGGDSHIGIPEIADYEVRRELLRAGKTRSVERLDSLKVRHIYVAITTAAMLLAAELWAAARRSARPTAPRERLDADVILVAQAIVLREQWDSVVVATSNVRHLSPFVDARRWEDIETTDG